MIVPQSHSLGVRFILFDLKAVRSLPTRLGPKAWLSTSVYPTVPICHAINLRCKFCEFCHCQKIFVTKTCIWFSVVSAMEDDHTTWEKGCCSTTYVNTSHILACILPLLWEIPFLCSSCYPLSQVFFFSGHWFKYKVFSLSNT